MGSRQAKSYPIYHLSQELVDEVIDTVFYTQDYWPYQWRDMSNCSLVCRSFLPRAQLHLFAHITLRGSKEEPNAHTRIISLLKIMDHRPEIARYIDKISLISACEHGTWMYDSPEMRQILHDITTTPSPLKSLVLKGYPWARYPSELMDRFIRPYIAPYITSLQLQGLLDAPTQLVSSCVNLKQLSVMFSTFRHVDGEQVSNSRPRIEQLEFGGKDLELTRVCSGLWLDLSDLCRLTVNTDFLEDLAVVQDVINSSHRALEEVTIRIYDPEQATNSFSTALDLSNQPHIRTLSQIGYFTRANSNTLSELCSTLRTIPQNSNLTMLEHVLDVGVVRLNDLKDFVLKAEWEALGSEIVRVTAGGDSPFTFILGINYYVDHLAENIKHSSAYQIFEDKAEEIGREMFRVIEHRLAIHKSIPECIISTAFFLIN